MNSPETTRDPLQPGDAREAQLRAAAGALRDWIGTRRTVWESQAAQSPRLASVLDDVLASGESTWTSQADEAGVEAATEEAAAAPRRSPFAIASAAVSRSAALFRKRHKADEEDEPDQIEDQDEDAPNDEVEEDEVDDDDVPFRRRLSIAALRSMAKPALRIGGYAAIVLALLALAGIARPYGSRLLARLSSATATPTSGTAVLETIPPDSDLTIDGKPAGKTPLIIELPTGHHVVEFKRRNNTRKLEIDVPPGRSTTGRIDWNAAPTGRLSASSDPPGARITVDGRDRGATPVEIDGLSVGDHVVVLRSEQGTVRRTVRVNVDETALVTESIYPGFLKVFAPFPIEILEGTRRLRLDEKNQIILAPGAHDLQFSSSSYGYRESKRVDITPGQTTPLSLVPPPSSLTVIASLPATVMIDGERAGEVPLNAYPIALGTREIVVRGATGAERRYTRQVTVAPLTIEVDFSKP